MGILSGLLFVRSNVDATLLRVPGQLFQHKGENISNVYTFRVVNKTSNNYQKIHFGILSHQGKIIPVGKPDLQIKSQGISQGTLFIEINKFMLDGDKTKLRIGVYSDKKLLQTITTNFLGPRTFN